jgi:NAD-dependent SIR2 family protein deacetylase
MKNDETSVFALTTEVLVKSKIVIISGAGISVAAGFPTFVDAKTGRYKASTKNIFDANVSTLNALTQVTSQFIELNEKAKGRFPPKN